MSSDRTKENRKLLWAILAGASLALSLTLYFLFPSTFSQRVIFFPETGKDSLGVEIHAIPSRYDRNNQIISLTENILRGPFSYQFQSLLPPETRLRALYFSENSLVVDLSGETQQIPFDTRLSVFSRLEILKKSIYFNFPDIKSIKVLIHGQEIGSFPYLGQGKS